MIRTNPILFVPYLQDLRTKFTGKKYINKQGIRIATHEGVEAVDEFIEFLMKQPRIHPLQWSEPLARASAYLAQIQGPTG